MALAGKSGKVMIGTSNVSEIKNWSVDTGADMLEDTVLGDEWKTFIAGLKEWSAKAEGLFALDTDTNGQTALQNAYLSGTPVTLKLYVSPTKFYSGFALISSLSVEDTVEDIVNISFEFQGSGQLSFT
jgi:predicted secreted protein